MGSKFHPPGEVSGEAVVHGLWNQKHLWAHIWTSHVTQIQSNGDVESLHLHPRTHAYMYLLICVSYRCLWWVTRTRSRESPHPQNTPLQSSHWYQWKFIENVSPFLSLLSISLAFPSFLSLTLTFSLSHSLSLSLARCLPPSLTPSHWVVLMRARICCFSPPLSQNRSLFLVVLLFHTHSRSLYLTSVLVSTFLCTLFLAWQGSFKCVAWTTLTLSWLCDSVLSHLFMHESCHTYE